MLTSIPKSDSSSILDQMAILGDPIRCRLLLVLERHELSVSELCATLQLPQSTVSRHLKLLSTAGWLEVRRDGTSRIYSAPERATEEADELWRLVREELVRTAEAGEDLRRVEAVLASRRSASKAFFSSASHRWADMREELFGSRFDLEALLALVDPGLVIGDLGAGNGQVVQALAPHVAKVIAIDESAEMLDAAATRLAGLTNVELRHGALESLPLDDGSLDAALLILVLHHLPEPQRVFREVARVLAPRGTFLVVDMLPHSREEYRRDMGHVWMGFEEAQIQDWLEGAGFSPPRFVALRPEPTMTGPSLFSASASLQPAARLKMPAKRRPKLESD